MFLKYCLYYQHLIYLIYDIWSQIFVFDFSKHTYQNRKCSTVSHHCTIYKLSWTARRDVLNIRTSVNIVIFVTCLREIFVKIFFPNLIFLSYSIFPPYQVWYQDVRLRLKAMFCENNSKCVSWNPTLWGKIALYLFISN